MRSIRDLEEAGERNGLTLLEVQEVPIPGGGWALSGRYEFDDPWAATRLLVERADQDAADPFVRTWSLEILAATADAIGETDGPTLSPALRGAFARAIQENVQHAIRFVQEPGEQFQSAATTMQTGAGDCDCHACLVYALGKAGGLDVAMAFIEEDGEPVHAVAELEGEDGALHFAETTIAARFGEEPYAALRRLAVSGSASPLAHTRTMSGPFGFVTADDVQQRKDEIEASFDATDADVVNCTSLDTGTLSAWNEFLATWRGFYADTPSFFTAGAQGRQTADYASQLAQWQADLKAKGCTMHAVPVNLGDDDASGTIKTVAVAAAVVAVALLGWQVARELR